MIGPMKKPQVMLELEHDRSSRFQNGIPAAPYIYIPFRSENAGDEPGRPAFVQIEILALLVRAVFLSDRKTLGTNLALSMSPERRSVLDENIWSSIGTHVAESGRSVSDRP
jgi:hypothetical protein